MLSRRAGLSASAGLSFSFIFMISPLKLYFWHVMTVKIRLTTDNGYVHVGRRDSQTERRHGGDRGSVA